MHKFIMLLASGFYTGYLPKAPGTWGSLVAIPVFLAVNKLSLSGYMGIVAGLFFLGTFASGEAEKILDFRDPGIVVIDEIVGMLIALTGIPAKPHFLILGFLLFRLFDILKPFPVNFFDQRVHGGLGIMLDDVVAGLYSLAILQLLRLALQ